MQSQQFKRFATHAASAFPDAVYEIRALKLGKQQDKERVHRLSGAGSLPSLYSFTTSGEGQQ
jgi:hypothetical protein